MKLLSRYFHIVLLVLYTTLTLGLWRKCYGVTIQRKPLLQYFHMVLFVSFSVLIFAKMKSASFLNFDFVFYTWGHRVKGAKDKVQLVCNPHLHSALPQAITTLKFKAYDTSIYKPHYEVEIPHVYMIRKH